MKAKKRFKNVVTKTPDEYMCFVPDEEEYFPELQSLTVAITGNKWFSDKGDKTLLDIIKGDYYDEDFAYDYEPLKELRKVTGKRWEKTTIRGYSQGDWQDVYFAVDEVAPEALERIKNAYFGLVSEFEVREKGEDSYIAYIPHDITWKGKKAICEYLALDPEDTKVLVDDGYVRTYNYKELED